MPVKPSEQEDEYFARLEVDRRKEALAARQQPAGTGAYQQEVAAQFYCPKCGASLIEMHFKGIEIDKCSRCQGIWLDCGELERMLLKEQGFLRALKRMFA